MAQVDAAIEEAQTDLSRPWRRNAGRPHWTDLRCHLAAEIRGPVLALNLWLDRGRVCASLSKIDFIGNELNGRVVLRRVACPQTPRFAMASVLQGSIMMHSPGHFSAASTTISI